MRWWGTDFTTPPKTPVAPHAPLALLPMRSSYDTPHAKRASGGSLPSLPMSPPPSTISRRAHLKESLPSFFHENAVKRAHKEAQSLLNRPPTIPSLPMSPPPTVLKSGAKGSILLVQQQQQQQHTPSTLVSARTQHDMEDLEREVISLRSTLLEGRMQQRGLQLEPPPSRDENFPSSLYGEREEEEEEEEEGKEVGGRSSTESGRGRSSRAGQPSPPLLLPPEPLVQFAPAPLPPPMLPPPPHRGTPAGRGVPPPPPPPSAAPNTSPFFGTITSPASASTAAATVASARHPPTPFSPATSGLPKGTVLSLADAASAISDTQRFAQTLFEARDAGTVEWLAAVGKREGVERARRGSPPTTLKERENASVVSLLSASVMSTFSDRQVDREVEEARLLSSPLLSFTGSMSSSSSGSGSGSGRSSSGKAQKDRPRVCIPIRPLLAASHTLPARKEALLSPSGGEESEVRGVSKVTTPPVPPFTPSLQSPLAPALMKVNGVQEAAAVSPSSQRPREINFVSEARTRGLTPPPQTSPATTTTIQRSSSSSSTAEEAINPFALPYLIPPPPGTVHALTPFDTTHLWGQFSGSEGGTQSSTTGIPIPVEVTMALLPLMKNSTVALSAALEELKGGVGMKRVAQTPPPSLPIAMGGGGGGGDVRVGGAGGGGVYALPSRASLTVLSKGSTPKGAGPPLLPTTKMLLAGSSSGATSATPQDPWA